MTKNLNLENVKRAMRALDNMQLELERLGNCEYINDSIGAEYVRLKAFIDASARNLHYLLQAAEDKESTMFNGAFYEVLERVHGGQ